MSVQHSVLEIDSYRIVTPAVKTEGHAVVEKMRAQILGLSRTMGNVPALIDFAEASQA